MNCPYCGQMIAAGSRFCEHCGAAIETQPQTQPEQTQTQPQVTAQPTLEKPEKTVPGIIGAVLGALLGAVAIFLFYQMDLVSALGGVALAFCSLKGYELLGGKLSMKGIIICIVLMLITPYLAHRVAVAYAWANDPAAYMTFAEGFEWFHEILNEAVSVGGLEEGAYAQEVLMLYGFTALGAVGIVASKVRNRNTNTNTNTQK